MIDIRALPDAALVGLRASIHFGVATDLQEASLDDLKRDSLKYDESEPRDEAGRWTAGADTAAALSRWSWSQGAKAIRASIAAGEPDAHAVALVKAINAAPATAPRLLRGISLTPQQVTRAFGPIWKPPKTDPDTLEPIHKPREPRFVDLNVSSWTTSPSTAAHFAGGGPYLPVTLSLHEGAQALDASGAASMFSEGESEWLTAGRFRVDMVQRDYGYRNNGEFGSTGYRVTLTQVGTLDLPGLVGTKILKFYEGTGFVSTKVLLAFRQIVKYSPEQPRDEAGRWSGGTYESSSTGTTRESVPIRNISMHRSAVEGTQQDILEGRGSYTRGPVHLIHNTENGQLLVFDGMHRIVEAMQAGRTTIRARVDHVPYSDAANVYDRWTESAQKYSPDQPRDDHGRWTAGEPDARGDAWTEVKAAIKRQGPGNCYQAAATLMMNAKALGLKNPVVVQATVVGQGPIAGKSFGHAWLEADYPGEIPAGFNASGFRVAYDYSSGKETELPAELYRHIGRVTDVHEYGPEEARLAMLRTGHYGPW